jgi:O-antigen ligase
MQIKKEYQNSKTKKVVEFLFGEINTQQLDNTRTGRLLQYLYVPYLSDVLLFVALVLFWYNGLLARYFVFPSMVASVCVLGAFVFSDKRQITIHKFHFWLVGFYLAALVSGLFGVLVLGLSAKMILLGWLLFAQFGLVILAAQGSKIKDKFLTGLVFLSLPLTLTAIYQFIFHFQTAKTWVSASENITTRAFAFLGSPNVLGATLSLVVILSVGLFFVKKNFLHFVISGLTLLAVVFTFSRSAWLGLLVAGFFVALIYSYRFLLAFLLLPFAFLVPEIKNRVLIAFTPNYLLDSSLDGRIWAYSNGQYIFKKFPLFGTGPGSYGGQLAINYASPVYLQSFQNGYTALYYTDNQLLEILIQGGLVGFLLFAGFFVALIRYLLVKFVTKKDIMALAGFACVICFIIMGLFENILEFGAVAVPMGIILGAISD